MDRSLFVKEVITQVKVINRTINDDDLLQFVVEDVVRMGIQKVLRNE